MKWFYWIYGLDITNVITPIVNKTELSSDLKCAYNEIKHDYRLNGNALISEAINPFNNEPQYHIGIAIAEWAEFEDHINKPTDDMILESVKTRTIERINRFYSNCPSLSSTVKNNPSLFLSKVEVHAESNSNKNINQ